MKLDLIEIDRLSPRGLYPLGVLQALVSMLNAVIGAGIGSARQLRSYAHMLAQYRNALRAQTRHNQHLKIKTWVMQCPMRMAWVRGVIGETTIRCWIIRMRAAYFSPKVMRDRREEKPGENRKRKYGPRTGKPFALAKLSQVEELLPFRPRWPRNVRGVVAQGIGNLPYGLRLTGNGQLEKTQPQQPVRFFPSELGISTLAPQTGNSQQALNYAEAAPARHPKKPNAPNKPRRPDAPPQEKPP